jgi:hypothetical protein
MLAASAAAEEALAQRGQAGELAASLTEGFGF